MPAPIPPTMAGLRKIPFRSRRPAWLAGGMALLVGCLGAVFAPAAAGGAESPPDIVFILSDDQSFETVRAFGLNDEIETPHLDRLAARGTTFTHAYNMGGWHGAVCVASRTMLNTGLFLWPARDAEPRLKSEWVPQRRMWPQLLADAGYATRFSGKWHVNADVARVFHEARHVRGGMPAQTPAGYHRPPAMGDDPWDPADPKFGGFWEGGRHWSEVLADDAVEFIRATDLPADRPRFLYLAFNAPHDPRQAPREFLDRYPPDRIAVPENFLPEYPFNEAMQSGRRLRDEMLAPFPRTERAVQVHRAEYFALITHLDAQIGRILDAVEESGRAANTVIVFTSDHGLACGHHGLMGKQNMFDHSMRVPFVVAGPGIEAGRRIDTPIYLQDIMPTTLELAGAEVPDHVQFKSLLPLLRGESSSAHHGSAVYGAYIDAQRMVIDHRHKLVVYPAAKRFLLFDLDSDPLETRDLLLDETPGSPHLARAAELFASMRRLQALMDDPLDLYSFSPRATKATDTSDASNASVDGDARRSLVSSPAVIQP